MSRVLVSPSPNVNAAFEHLIANASRSETINSCFSKKSFANSGSDFATDAHVAYRVRAAAPEDAARLAPVMRAADRAEMLAVGGFSPLGALERSLANSPTAYAVELEDGHVAALFGVGARAEAPDIGAPWLLGSDRLLELRRPFVKHARGWIERLGRDYALLANIVDARNGVHIRWLKWTGFIFIRRLSEFGPERRPFLEFALLNKGDSHV